MLGGSERHKCTGTFPIRLIRVKLPLNLDTAIPNSSITGVNSCEVITDVIWRSGPAWKSGHKGTSRWRSNEWLLQQLQKGARWHERTGRYHHFWRRLYQDSSRLRQPATHTTRTALAGRKHEGLRCWNWKYNKVHHSPLQCIYLHTRPHHWENDQSRKNSHHCVADQLHELVPEREKNIGKNII